MARRITACRLQGATGSGCSRPSDCIRSTSLAIRSTSSVISVVSALSAGVSLAAQQLRRSADRRERVLDLMGKDGRRAQRRFVALAQRFGCADVVHRQHLPARMTDHWRENKIQLVFDLAAKAGFDRQGRNLGISQLQPLVEPGFRRIRQLRREICPTSRLAPIPINCSAAGLAPRMVRPGPSSSTALDRLASCSSDRGSLAHAARRLRNGS